MQTTLGKYPPKPQFSVAVGIIGHRPNRLPAELIDTIALETRQALASIRAAALAAHARYGDWFSPDAPRLTVVSSLAEGADRIGAGEALSQGFALDVPLPFPADEYAGDFADPDLRREFDRLFAAASSVLTLSGDRSEDGKAYEHAGNVLLDNCDILVTVWDGEPSAGRGGTTELLYEAAHMGIPIIRIGTSPDHRMRLYWREPGSRRTPAAHFHEELRGHATADITAAIHTAIDRLVRPPGAPPEQEAMRDYLCRPFRRFNLNAAFPLLQAALGVRWPRLSDFVRPAERELEGGQDVPAPLGEAHLMADECAIYFGQAFRGAFILNFVLSALVTISVVLTLSPPASAVEILLVALLVYNTSRGRKGRWHHLWIEAREIAERIRGAIPIRAFGSRPALPYGDASTWTTWYVRAHLRQAGMRSAALDAAGMAAARQALLDLLEGQKAYHAVTARRFRHLHERLANVGKWIFFLTLAMSIVIFAIEYSGLIQFGETGKRWIFVLSAGLPALAAASYGIRVIGEFDGAAARSARMVTQLEGLIQRLQAAGGDLETLRDISHRTADVVQGDVASWRLVAESRELEMPGLKPPVRRQEKVYNVPARDREADP